MHKDSLTKIVDTGDDYEHARMLRAYRGVFERKHFEEALEISPITAMNYVFPLDLSYADGGLKNDHEKDMYAYEYIPYYPHAFLEKLQKVCDLFRDEDIHFLDCGCGPGEKVFLAKYGLGVESATGLEYNEITYNLGRFFLKHLGCNLIHGDAFEFDFRPYNLIYLYHPLTNEEKLWEMYQHIWATMPEGGVFVEVLLRGEHYNRYLENKGMLTISEEEYDDATDYVNDLPQGDWCINCNGDWCKDGDHVCPTDEEKEEAERLMDEVIGQWEDEYCGSVPNPFVLRKVNGEMIEV